MMNRHYWILLPLLIALAACGVGKDDDFAIPPPPTAAPTIIAEVLPTAVPTKPQPSAPAATLPPVVVEEVATLPPPPTVAPVPTDVPEAGDPTPLPGGLILEKPEDFANRNPFTGELVANPDDLLRRPILVKIANAPADYTRPQAGLNDADIIFEHWTEAAVTRFTALFYDTIPADVGPIRSARLIDVELPAMYDAALAFSGASVGVNRRLNASDFSDRVMRSREPGFYRTGDETKAFEHTLYIRLNELWDALDEKGLNRQPRITTINVFSEESPAGGSPAGKILIDYQTEKIEWVWDPDLGKYLRWMDFEEHVDATTEEQVTAANVIIVSPFHVNDPEICEQIGADGTCAALSVEIQLWGSGGGTVFRDGQRYEVTWHRDGRNDQLTFRDSQGNPFPLQIGNSWVQIVPGFLDNSLTVEP